ncbi:hypothetical protein SacmaDRAFT_3427 [Saccharomonospora marina XMU15]|uniref:Uncharacterized protein n=1 Tax=Saccharomonospora marina XMU15 TaxID=882083 RepID=H5WWN4_9PSEU|nr:hypothetical protein [Saccharomonospora marina]EHR51647.1 hypothetical protein SacmaDRAFT_3427 [Saccharomonospora marina XMU15]
MPMRVEGPAWSEPGLDRNGGRYPLGVEAPVMAMVDRLVPGASTLTRFVRYYSLYWALAEFAERRGLDTPQCRTMVRRAEVALGLVSVVLGEDPPAHGADHVRKQLGKGNVESLAELGPGAYSPRQWGFWSQYNGPSVVLGTVKLDAEALRRGRHPLPVDIRQMYRPLLELVEHRPVALDEVSGFASLAVQSANTADIDALRGLFTATRAGSHVPGEWLGNDRTRRATMRILARSVQLRAADGWVDAMRSAVAFGDALSSDPVLSNEERALAWRGLLLRHFSVGAWRKLWAQLVDHVQSGAGSATKDDLYAWIAQDLSDVSVQQFVHGLPAQVDAHGQPLAAETEVRDGRSEVEADLAVLLIGSRRLKSLSGRAREAFQGHSGGRGQYLDPRWIDYQHREHEGRSLADFARALVDDMLAQSTRVAQRKLKVDANGRMRLFAKLHERNGRYFATQREGAGNVGLRIEQLGTMATQLGLFDVSGARPVVTDAATQLLDLPA